MKASPASRKPPASRSAPASPSHPPTPAPLGPPAAPEFSAAASLAPAQPHTAGRPAAQPLESTQEPAPPKPQSPPKFCEYSFSESSSHALPRLDFSSTKLAFYPETDSFLQGGSRAAAFLRNCMSALRKPENLSSSSPKLTSVPILWNHRMRT